MSMFDEWVILFRHRRRRHRRPKFLVLTFYAVHHGRFIVMANGSYDFDQPARVIVTAFDRKGNSVPFTEPPKWSAPPEGVTAKVSDDGTSEVLTATAPTDVNINVTYAGLSADHVLKFTNLQATELRITDEPADGGTGTTPPAELEQQPPPI